MKTLIFKKSEIMNSTFRWEDDVFRIVDLCFKKGFEISTLDAQAAWEEYSDDYASCWLTLSDSDDKVFDIVYKYCIVKE